MAEETQVVRPLHLTEVNGAVGSIGPLPDTRRYFLEYLLDKSEEHFGEALDCEYHGRAEWAGLHARIGWHYLSMAEELNG